MFEVLFVQVDCLFVTILVNLHVSFGDLRDEAIKSITIITTTTLLCFFLPIPYAFIFIDVLSILTSIFTWPITFVLKDKIWYLLPRKCTILLLFID